MSDLQLSLILLGVIGVLGTYAFNRWQERKYRKQADKMFSGTRQDVLFDEPPSTRTQSAPSRAERIEPSLAADAPPEAAQSTAAQARVTAYSATNMRTPLRLRQPLRRPDRRDQQSSAAAGRAAATQLPAAFDWAVSCDFARAAGAHRAD
jgi:FtsZ-interacting cell division protein ZipA